MRVWTLVSGILSIVLSVFVTFQSGIAGLSNTLENNGEVGGSAGLFVAILVLAGGIVSIVTKNNRNKGGNIAVIVLFGLGAVLGFIGAGSYGDLQLWAAWCLICAVLAIVNIIKNKKAV